MNECILRGLRAFVIKWLHVINSSGLPSHDHDVITCTSCIAPSLQPITLKMAHVQEEQPIR